jgi:hypothetical protein
VITTAIKIWETFFRRPKFLVDQSWISHAGGWVLRLSIANVGSKAGTIQEMRLGTDETPVEEGFLVGGHAGTFPHSIRPDESLGPIDVIAASPSTDSFQQAQAEERTSVACPLALRDNLITWAVLETPKERARRLDGKPVRRPNVVAIRSHAWARVLGNFGAHPIKSEETGAVVEVEPGEAEAALDMLRELLDFFFVKPARREQRRAAWNAKLAEAGKPPLKETEAE